MKSTWERPLLSLLAVLFVGVIGCALLWNDAIAEGEAKTPRKAMVKRADKEQSKTTKKSPGDDSAQIDPMSVNATCYVCHMTFVHEKISSEHFQAKVTCVECHGLSAKHANDENIGATKPDIAYPRKSIDKMCEKCHEEHDVSPRKVVSRFMQRKLPAERPPVCTDCHGSHRIEREEEADQSKADKKNAGKTSETKNGAQELPR